MSRVRSTTSVTAGRASRSGNVRAMPMGASVTSGVTPAGHTSAGAPPRGAAAMTSPVAASHRARAMAPSAAAACPSTTIWTS